MSSASTGKQAEEAAAAFLRNQGFSIVDRNWRTRWCEIDIVAKRDNCMHFVEVKYRSSSKWGSALTYITPTKLKQMKFASKMWVHRYRWAGMYRLAALAIDDTSAKLVPIDS